MTTATVPCFSPASIRRQSENTASVCSGRAEETVSAELTELIRKIEEKGYTMAYGMEYALSVDDFEAMVNRADEKMLRNKAEYYKQRDRRAR